MEFYSSLDEALQGDGIVRGSKDKEVFFITPLLFKRMTLKSQGQMKTSFWH